MFCKANVEVGGRSGATYYLSGGALSRGGVLSLGVFTAGLEILSHTSVWRPKEVGLVQ